MSFSTAFGVMFLFYAAFTVVGFLSVRLGNVRAARLAALTWNSRINKLNMRPFTCLIEAMERGDYRGTAAWAVILNAGTAVLQFIMGVLLLAPFIAGFAGMSVGYLFSLGERDTLLPNALVRIVEYGAFAAAGATGLVVGAEWMLYSNAGLEQVLSGSMPFLYRGFGLTLLLLAAAGLLEAAFGVRRGVKGIPPLESVRNKEYLDLDS